MSMEEYLSEQEYLHEMSRNRLDLVCKSNELIEAQFDLSASAQKVNAVLVSQINPRGKILPRFDLSVTEYAKLVGISPQAAYKSIDAITTELKKLVVNLRDRGSKSFIKLSMFRECRYDDEQKRVWFEFESRLDAHLRDFAGTFTSYQVEQIKKLKSRYAIRMYEILRKAHPLKTKKNYSTYPVSIEDLRLMLGIFDDRYSNYSDFRKSVLNKVKETFEQDTDLKFKYEGIRKGRKIGLVKFTIQHNEKNREKSGELRHANLTELDPKVRAMANQFIPWLPDNDLDAMAIYGREVLIESIMDMLDALRKHDIAECSQVSYFRKIVNANSKKAKDEDTEKEIFTFFDKMNDRSWDQDQADDDFLNGLDD